MNTTVKLPSGASLEIGLLAAEEAWAVSQALLKEVEKLPFDVTGGIDFSVLLNQAGILALKGPICSILSSPVLLAEAQKCFKQCTYNGIRIDKSTFEKRDCRGDLLPAAFYALKENVAPFFVGLSSFLTKS